MVYLQRRKKGRVQNAVFYNVHLRNIAIKNIILKNNKIKI